MAGTKRQRTEVLEYAGPSRREVAFLENVWRAQAQIARCASLSLIFWRLLPMDVIRLIASLTWTELRVSDVTPRSPPTSVVCRTACSATSYVAEVFQPQRYLVA